MTTDRKFCRFGRTEAASPFGVRWDQDGGLCLSAFVLVRRGSAPSEVLLGRMNPTAPWDHLGSLDPARVEAHRHGWVLPASHLLLREAPPEAGARILAEQLADLPVRLGPARVVSEVYSPRRYPDHPSHWDLQFLLEGTWDGPPPSAPGVWNELRFVEVPRAPRSSFARSHDEILELAGLTPGPG